MRHKQRPIKSSRHKSVTSLNDCPQTSFKHYPGHMNDVMRLAFLENNDITPETWKDIDFNSLSTASILKRNIQRQLQADQVHSNNHNHNHNHNHHHHHQDHFQVAQAHEHFQEPHAQYDDDDEDESFETNDDYNDYNDSYVVTDSGIFATQLPTTSLNHTDAVASAPLWAQQQVSNRNSKGARRATNLSQMSLPDESIVQSPEPHIDFKPVMNQSGGFLCDEPDCGKVFPSVRKLRHHKVVHSDEFPFICQFKGCEKKFKRKFGIDLHSTTHFDLDPEMYAKTSNNSSLPFFGRRMQYSMCKPCNQKFKTVHEYQYHMLKHGKEPFKCPVKGCGQTFSIWKSFQKHRASHYFNYYCKLDPRCDHSTSNLQLLKLHIYCCHFQRKLPENATLSSRNPLNKTSCEEANELDDSQQEQSFDADGDQLSHTMEDVEEQQDEDSFKSQMDLTHDQAQEPEPEPCDESVDTDDYNYDESYALSDSSIFATQLPTTSLNQNDAVASTPLWAPQVSKRNSKGTRRAANLSQMSLQDDSIAQTPESQIDFKPNMSQSSGFLCDEPDCGKVFPSVRKLRHHKVVHSDEFPFICQFKGCEKKFKRKFGIDLHSTTHFDLDPEMYAKTSNNSSLPFFGRRMQYSMCKPCNQKFKTVHEYQYHMLKHGKEPFKCPVKGCGQTFSIWKSFQKHRASHYFNYYCKLDPRCDHSTSNLQLLKLHIYCCHFQRKLPENATLSSRDLPLDTPAKEVEAKLDESQEEDQEEHEEEDQGEHSFDIEQQSSELPKDVEEQQIDDTLTSQKSTPSTPRRDPRLRRNPPRSSTFGQQDYAAMSNGSNFARLIASPPSRRSRMLVTPKSGSQPNTPDKKTDTKTPLKVLPKRACASITSSGSQPTSPEKKTKSPMKVAPKRTPQRLPMSLIAADEGSTEDDDGSDVGSSRSDSRGNGEGDMDNCDARFKCHLCDYKFSVRFQLTKHLSTHLELSLGMYSATADAKVIQLSERRRREFYCDKCNVKFEKMSDLDGHMRKHGTRPYVCPFCQVPSTFKFAKQYLSHLYEHRFNYRCTMEPSCDFTINRKDALKLHIFRMHLNQQLPAYIENFANMADCNEWSEQ